MKIKPKQTKKQYEPDHKEMVELTEMMALATPRRNIRLTGLKEDYIDKPHF